MTLETVVQIMQKKYSLSIKQEQMEAKSTNTSFGSMPLDLTRSPTSELTMLYIVSDINIFKQEPNGSIHIKRIKESFNQIGKALSDLL